jgi:hypothetical protein
MSDSKTNDILWEEIKKLSKGNIQSKITAVDMIISNFRIFPQSFSLIKALANKTQPSEVRIRVAMKMREAPLRVKERSELMKVLFQNADKDLLACLRLMNMSSLVFYKLLENINPAKTINDAVRNINPAKTINDAVRNINPAKTINDTLQLQTKLFNEIMNLQMSKFLQSPKWSLLGNDYAKSAKPYVSFLDINKQLTLPFRNQLNRSVSYYSKAELEPVKSPPEVPTLTEASKLLQNLQDCEPGKKHWKKYQDICKEILCYCLVPPLMEPLEQSGTRDGMHIRDIIFHIPHELGGFWTFIIDKFGIALVIECKNYENLIDENQLLISSKYVGKHKLSRLGLVVTRKGLSNNGIKSQENIWKSDGKMLLCMDDKDITKMLQLKNDGDEPWKVIDKNMRDFMTSLS